MNRITNKEYLIDITIHSLEAHQPFPNTKVKCQIHYGDDSYLRLQLQPLIRHGVAFFYGQHIRIPYSPEVSLVFKLVNPSTKKQLFLGHFMLEVEKMLAEKIWHFKLRDKLEESDAYVDFQCKIMDKQLLAESDEDQLPEVNAQDNKSIVTWMKKGKNQLQFKKSMSDYHTKLNSKKVLTEKTVVPPTQEEYGKVVREAEDILKKRQLFAKRHEVLNGFTRDHKGNLSTRKIKELKGRLEQARSQHFNSTIVLYVFISLVAFFLGLKM